MHGFGRCTRTIVVVTLTAFATTATAGELEPPGAPAPTSKPLAEIEPRTAIPQLPFTIDASGSYYLTESLTGASGQNGITIDANDVTLDLAGFSLVGVTGSLDGIAGLATRSNVTVENGTVSGWGDDGLDLSLVPQVLVSHLRAEGNGAAGIRVGDAASVFDSTAHGNTAAGFVAGSGGVIRGCVAAGNDGGGVVVADGATVSGCTAHGNDGTGILVGSGSSVLDCVTRANTGFQASGIHAEGTGAIVRDNTSSSNGAWGIRVNHATLVTGNQCNDNSSGIQTNGNDNRIENNNLTNNWLFGINTGSTGNIIIRNTASGNGTQYNITAGNFAGTIVTTVAGMNAATNDLINVGF